jgi:2-dehydropantoate 2-reductase
MKVAVLGAGAMGALFGGMLAEAGCEVWLVDVWREHVEAIGREGLHIVGSAGERTIRNLRPTCRPEEAGVADLVLVFVKSTVTEAAVAGARSLFGPRTLVLTLQNGLGNIEKIATVVAPGQMVAGVTTYGANVLGPGRIRHAGSGPTSVGELDGSLSPRIQSVAETLNHAGIESHVSDNVLGLIWGKLMVNVGLNALTALTGLRNGQLLDFEETEELMALAVLEAAEVARAKGIRLPYDDPVEHAKAVARATGENRSSMLQDVSNRRRTEIDMINGAIVREGKALGLQTPVNLALWNLVRMQERSYLS